MIIGNKETIAVQFELDTSYGGFKRMFGKFCFYINNQMVGLYDMGANLNTIIVDFRSFIQDKDKRYFPQLFSLKDREILEIIIHSCFNSSIIKNPFHYLNISIGDECMDPFFIYAIDGENETKIIYGQCCLMINGKRSNTRINNKYNFKEDPENIIFSIVIPKKEFVYLIKKTYEELNKIYEQLKQV